MHRQAAAGREPQQRHAMAVARQGEADLLEAAEGAPPARPGAEMADKRRRRPFEAGPRRQACRRRLDGDLVEPRQRALQRRLLQRSSRLIFQKRATQGAEPLDDAAGRRIERDMQRHREREAAGQGAGGVVQQQLVGGRMAAHERSFSNASRSRPSARRMRDFTVPSGSLSSSAMAECVLSSKKAFRMTTS